MNPACVLMVKFCVSEEKRKKKDHFHARHSRKYCWFQELSCHDSSGTRGVEKGTRFMYKHLTQPAR